MRRKRTSVNAIFSFKRRRGRRKKTTFPLKSISLTMFCFINNNIRGSNHRKRRAREKNPRHCIGINFHRLFENDVFLSRLNSVLLWLWSICNCMLNVCHRLTCTTINKKKKKKRAKVWEKYWRHWSWIEPVLSLGRFSSSVIHTLWNRWHKHDN